MTVQDGIGHLDWFDTSIECWFPRCDQPAVFIARFPEHAHFTDRWYPVCLLHEPQSRQTTCKGCGGTKFQRSTIETL